VTLPLAARLRCLDKWRSNSRTQRDQTSLADFIESDLQGLIDDWAKHARAITHEGAQLSETQLRDSAAEILADIAADMRSMQSATQQEAKSRGSAGGSQSGTGGLSARG